MNKEVYTGILGEIQEEYNKLYPEREFNPEHMNESYYCDLSDYKWIEFTGDEGYGENCHVIFMWKGEYYRLGGFSWKSHYGLDWYGGSGSVTKVTPKTVTTTIYE